MQCYVVLLFALYLFSLTADLFFSGQVGDLQGRVTDLVGVSATAGKKLFNATMYIPSMALELSGEVFVSAKNLVFAFTKVKLKRKQCKSTKASYVKCEKKERNFQNSKVAKFQLGWPLHSGKQFSKYTDQLDKNCTYSILSEREPGN